MSEVYILKEGLWDTFVKTAKAVRDVGKTNEQKLGEYLYDTYIKWCSKNRHDMYDKDNIEDFLSQAFGSAQFIHSWIEKFEDYIDDSKVQPIIRDTPEPEEEEYRSIQDDSDTEHINIDDEEDQDQEQEQELLYKQQEFIKHHMNAKPHFQNAYPAGHLLNKRADGLFLVIDKHNIVDIRNDLLQKNNMYKNMPEYFDEGYLMTWRQASLHLSVSGSLDSLLSCIKSASDHLGVNYLRQGNRFIIMKPKGTAKTFTGIVESVIVEGSKRDLKKFFLDLAHDPQAMGTGKKRAKETMTKRQTSDQDNYLKNLNAGWSEVTVRFSQDEMDLIDDLNKEFENGLAGLASINHTANIKHRKEAINMVKRIVSSAMKNLQNT